MDRFTERPSTWQDLDQGYSPDIMRIATADAVRAALPGGQEQMKGALKMGDVDFWTDDPRQVIARINPGDDLVRLYVHHITSDASGRLKVEGTGKGARHVKIPGPVDSPAVTRLIEQVHAAYRAGTESAAGVRPDPRSTGTLEPGSGP